MGGSVNNNVWSQDLGPSEGNVLLLFSLLVLSILLMQFGFYFSFMWGGLQCVFAKGSSMNELFKYCPHIDISTSRQSSHSTLVPTGDFMAHGSVTVWLSSQVSAGRRLWTLSLEGICHCVCICACLWKDYIGGAFVLGGRTEPASR